MAASRGPGNSTWAHVGGQVGALLISPLVKAGTTSQEPYNQFLAAAHDRGPVLCGPPGLRRRQQSRLVAGLAVLRLQAALSAGAASARAIVGACIHQQRVVSDRLAPLAGAPKHPLQRAHLTRAAQVARP